MELDQQFAESGVGLDHTVREFNGESDIQHRAAAQWHTFVDEPDESA